MTKQEIMQKVIDVARREWQHEGDIEIDDEAKPSVGDPVEGLYVSAWVWVRLEDLPGITAADLKGLHDG
jgi:hypothetical protein